MRATRWTLKRPEQVFRLLRFPAVANDAFAPLLLPARKLVLAARVRVFAGLELDLHRVTHEAQRVAIAAALLRSPDLVLMDEPLASLESAAQDLVNYGDSPAFYYDYARTVRALSEGDLAEAVGRVVSPEQLIWVVVGDLEKIEAEVRALGWGEVVRLDGPARTGDQAAM